MENLTTDEAIDALIHGWKVKVTLLDGKTYDVLRIRQSILPDFDTYIMYRSESGWAVDLFVMDENVSFIGEERAA
jgi:hypothetical protein